jgi:hypothetical protein
VANVPEGENRPVDRAESSLWFARTERGVRITSWKGRATLMGWALLVVIALVTYSTLGITVFVVGFYTAVLLGVVAVKSDLLDEYRQPKS